MTKDEAEKIKPAVICHVPGDRCMACPHYYGKAEFCTYKIEADDLEKLQGFVRDIMKSWPLGDVEGDRLQTLALKHGLIKLKAPPPDEPCHEECTCADYFTYRDFSDGIVECYEKTELLQAL